MQLMQMVIIRMQIQPSEASLDAKYVGMGARFPRSQRFVGFVPVHFDLNIGACAETHK